MDRRELLIGMAAAGPMLGFANSGAALTLPPPDPVLDAMIAGEWRTPAAKARDVWRHPAASLRFWGLKPGAVVIDVDPGGGWWTEILAPYLARTGGRYIAAMPDAGDPEVSERAAKAAAAFQAKFADTKRYGDVAVVSFGARSGALAPPGTVDLVLVSRETHNWARIDGFTQKTFGELHAALKPGGVLAIEDHRAADGADPKKGDGYISEAWVIGEAKHAGFALAARSEINANPKDTKDHPFGVWTLPPTRQSAPTGQPPNPAFDHAKYDAIGESDRMTLKFVRV